MRGLLKRNFGALNYNERCVISDMPTHITERRKGGKRREMHYVGNRSITAEETYITFLILSNK